jgi:hypothetical protein
MGAANLSLVLAGLDALISERLAWYLGQSAKSSKSARPLDEYRFEPSQFSDLNNGCKLSLEEHVILLLAFVPHVRPDFFGRLIGQYLPDGGDLPEFGGVRAEHHRGVLPTDDWRCSACCRASIGSPGAVCCGSTRCERGSP